MAKISANGAHEVARIKARRPGTTTETIYVMTSDGRVLYRWTGDSANGYTVRTRRIRIDRRNEATLRVIARHDGRTEILN